MMKVQLLPGVYTSGVGFAAAGIAFSDPHYLAFRYALYVLAAMLFLWGTKLNGKHLWQLPSNMFKRPARLGVVYVGYIHLYSGNLDEKHVLDISIDCYNGTLSDMTITEVRGNIEITTIFENDANKRILLSTPNTPHIKLPAGEGVQIAFEQPIRPDQFAALTESLNAGEQTQLLFRAFDIMVKSRWGKPTRIALWDGIAISNGRTAGKVVFVSIGDTLAVRDD